MDELCQEIGWTRVGLRSEDDRRRRSYVYGSSEAIRLLQARLESLPEIQDLTPAMASDLLGILNEGEKAHEKRGIPKNEEAIALLRKLLGRLSLHTVEVPWEEYAAKLGFVVSHPFTHIYQIRRADNQTLMGEWWPKKGATKEGGRVRGPWCRCNADMIAWLQKLAGIAGFQIPD